MQKLPRSRLLNPSHHFYNSKYQNVLPVPRTMHVEFRLLSTSVWLMCIRSKTFLSVCRDSVHHVGLVTSIPVLLLIASFLMCSSLDIPRTFLSQFIISATRILCSSCSQLPSDQRVDQYSCTGFTCLQPSSVWFLVLIYDNSRWSLKLHKIVQFLLISASHLPSCEISPPRYTNSLACSMLLALTFSFRFGSSFPIFITRFCQTKRLPCHA